MSFASVTPVNPFRSVTDLESGFKSSDSTSAIPPAIGPIVPFPKQPTIPTTSAQGAPNSGFRPVTTSPVKIVSSRAGGVEQKSNVITEAQKSLDALNEFEKQLAKSNSQGLTTSQMSGLQYDAQHNPILPSMNTSPTPATGTVPSAGPTPSPTSVSGSPSTSDGILSTVNSNYDADFQKLQKNSTDALDAYNKAMNTYNAGLTANDNQKIYDAAAAAGADYDTLIRDAQEKKRQGMGKAVVNAGEAGGFMNSQVAGRAAVAPTSGENAFVGVGGTLENVQSAYDAAISNLQAQKIAAVTRAKMTAEQAIRSGKKEDLDIAQKFFEQAQEAYKTAITLADNHATAVANIKSKEQDLNGPVTVSAGQNLVDPKTGQVIYQAPFKPGAPKFFTDNEGNVTALDPITGERKSLGQIGKGNTPKFFTDNSGTVTMFNPLTQETISLGDIGKSASTQNPATIAAIADAVLAGQVSVAALGNYGGAKNAIIAKVLEKNPNYSVTDDSLSYEAKKKYTDYINSPAYQNTIKYLDSVEYSLNTVQNLSNQIDRTKFPIINKAVLETMKQTGDTNVVAYATAVTEVADQIAKILQGGGTGSGSSDAKLRQAVELFDGSYSKEQLSAAIGSIRELLNSRNEALKKDTWRMIGGSPESSPGSAGASANASTQPRTQSPSSSSSSGLSGGFATSWF